MFNLSLPEALEHSVSANVIPIFQTLFTTTETPLSVYEKLAARRSGTFLLESAEQGVWARYSFIGVKNRGELRWMTGPVVWQSSDGSNALPDGSALPNTPLEALNALQSAWKSPVIDDLPPLTSGLVGLIGWNMVREIENLPHKPAADYDSPNLAFAMFRDLVIFDHLKGNLLLVSNIFTPDHVDFESGYNQALERIAQIRHDLLSTRPGILGVLDMDADRAVKYRSSKADFFASVDRAKHYVRIGDVFQVVLSQRFDIESTANSLDTYSVLRALNPSPYMYLLNFEDSNGPYAVVGSSPESLVKVNQRHAVTHPIAGSRPRGNTPDEDLELSSGLVADPKERAEHLMLVDLARNDLLKVCEPDSVTVTEFMQIHRYSHVMHLVSTVEGDLRHDQSPVDAFRATFPAGTLSGAPKPRALEIIDELEPTDRGIYGGVVGYFDFAGNADLAISIRTAFIRDGVARVQAGAGLVLDSVPELEFDETVNKASAPARAVAIANSLRKILD